MRALWDLLVRDEVDSGHMIKVVTLGISRHFPASSFAPMFREYATDIYREAREGVEDCLNGGAPLNDSPSNVSTVDLDQG